MNHRIGARGILIGPDDKILLSLEVPPNGEHLWVPPGGGMEPEDGSILDCVRREFLEETGLTVEVGPLLYIREFFEPSRSMHHLGLLFLVYGHQGEVHETDADQPPQGADLQRHARWFSQEDLQTVHVVPEELREAFWRDRAAGVTQVQYLGVGHELERHMLD